MTVEHDADIPVSQQPSPRLCNEIQLFDLCDLESCSFKEGRFCSNGELLTAFDRISDAEEARSTAYLSEDMEEGEESAEGEYDDAFEDDGYGDEAEYED